MTRSPSPPPSTPTHRGGHDRAQAGFTLVELLLASLLGIIVVGGVYQLFVNTSTHYMKQLDHGQAQSRLRFAVEFIKADLRSFGRLSILNTDLAQRDPLFVEKFQDNLIGHCSVKLCAAAQPQAAD